MTSSSLPGVSVGEKPRRFVPRFHWELLACGVDGHELIGLDAREVRPDDAPIVREIDGVRWYRCLRCDSWLPVPEPQSGETTRDHLPPLDQIELPLRGNPRGDKMGRRPLAVAPAFPFVVLGLLAIAVFLFASHQADL